MRKEFIILFVLILGCGSAQLTMTARGQQMYLPIPVGSGLGPVVHYWTWNATYMGTSGSLSGGNLTYAPGGTNTVVIATLPGGTAGKNGFDYYYEVTVTSLGNNESIGLENSLSPNFNTWMGADVHGYGYYSSGAAAGSWLAGSISFTPPPTTIFNSGDVVGILYKGSTNQIVMYVKHGGVTTLEATFSIASSSGGYYPAMSGNGSVTTANFGASAWQLAGAPFGGLPWTN